MAVAGWGTVVFTYWFLLRNAEAWFFFKEGFKKGGAVYENLDPSGTVKFIHVEGGKDESVLTGLKGRMYVFLPRFVRAYNIPENATEEKLAELELEKHKYNDMLKKRVYLEGIRKPLIHGSKAAAIGAPASMIAEMEKARLIDSDMAKMWKDTFGKLSAKALDRVNVAVELAHFWSIDTLLEFVRYSYSEYDIKAVEEDYYSKGWAANNKMGKMKGGSDWGWIIWPLLLGGAAVVFWWLNDSGILKRFMGG